jgi:formylglycine-generating enzyme required for sulfatase activity
MVARFRSEPGTTGILKHKNIVTIHDFGEHESAPYLVMELLEGRSLREAIENGPPLSLLEKVTILAEIARGLLHAHQNGVIHRDVKPANIMLLADGAVKILDFGIARIVDRDLSRQTSAGTMLGTAEYMSPEQFEGEDATTLSDVYSYGVVCYELLSGKQPFRASHWMAVAHLITTRVPEPLRMLAPECPAALETIVKKAMARRPSERYPSLKHLVLDLAPIEAGLRTGQIDSLANEAARWLEAGDLNSAEKVVFQALDVDPTHPRSQEVWRLIQRLRERHALEERLQGVVQQAERLLEQKSFDEAIQVIEEMGGCLGSDSVADLREKLEARLSAAREAKDKAHAIAAGALAPTVQQEAATIVEAPRPRSRSWILPAIACALLIVAGVSAAIWRQRSLRPIMGPTPPAATQDEHTAESAAIRKALGEERWADALDGIQALRALAPRDARLPDWERQASGGLERRQQIDAIRSMTSSAIQARDWAAAEKGLDQLLKSAPKDAEALAWRTLLREGKQGELIAAENADRQKRIGNLRADIDLAVAGRNWKGARRGVDELLKLAPSDGGVVEWQKRIEAGIADDLRGSGRPARAAGEATPTLPDSPAVGNPGASASPSPLPSVLNGPQAPLPPAKGAAVEVKLKVNPKDGLNYVWIPPGTFLMGCSPGDNECSGDEKPAHQVTITRGFWMGQTEVTQESYQKVTGKNPSRFKAALLPVGGVTWSNAQNYCQTIDMRLPTEAEWEYAARAGTTGARYGDVDRLAWFLGNSGGQAHLVGGKLPNTWGLYDTLGNVDEWVEDWFEVYTGGSAPHGPWRGTHVLRGGSWVDPARVARVSNRHKDWPEDRHSDWGFRCAGN